MKKVYTRPEIFFESFAASDSIAGNCDRVFTLAKQDICAIPDDNGIPGLNMSIFNISIVGSECGISGGDEAMYDGFCYYVPTETNTLFNS